MQKTLLIGIASLGIVALVFIDRWQVTHWRAEKEIELHAMAELCQTRLENVIASRLNAVQAISSLFVLHPETKSEEFTHFAAMLLKFNPPIRALQYADSKTRVTYVYPPERNEITITKPMILLTDPERGPFVEKAISQKTASVQGPFELRQGGTGLVVRSPIFLEERFIGLAIGVYDVPVLIQEALLGINLNQFAYRLVDSEGRLFWGSDNISGDFQEKVILVADSQWTFSLNWAGDTTHSPVLTRVLIMVCGAGFLLSSLLLIYFLQARTRHLQLIVEERTQDLSKSNKSLIDEIFERKKTEKSLRESETHLRTLIETIPDLIWLKDPNGVYLSCNRKFERFYGSEEADIVGKTDYNFVSKELADFFREKDKAAMVADKPIINEEEISYADDGHRELLETVKTTMYDSEGKLIGVLGVARDITKRKQAEDELNRIFELSPDLVGMANLNEGYFKRINPAWKIFGRPLEEFISRPFIDLIHPDDQNKTENQVKRMQSGQYVFGFENRYRCKDGSYRTIEWRATSAQADGTVYVSGRDVTERNRAVEEKEKLESRLRQAQKMESIGTLAGGIAHDFNNILYPLIGYTEMLQEDLPKNSPEQESIAEILHAALRAKDLVKQILAVSRQNDQELKPVKLQSILKEAMKLLKSSIPSTIDIHTDIDSDCGMVVADATQIHQIIMNLATNAYHAMQESGGLLKLTLNQTQIESSPLGFSEFLPGEYAVLKITDTGTGIKKDVMDKIFDPYFTTKETGKGTGLGLSVVQGIVKSCHGDIHVYSEPGKGTEVHVYLPIIKKLSKKDLPDPSEPIQGGAERILLVDDEEIIIKMEKRMLERLGYHVTSRAGSLEAFEVFKANPDTFDLIVSDMTMPNMTGVQLANKIKAVRTDIPIIICTGFSDQINEKTSKKLGIQGYIMKPVIIREIAKTIREVLKESKNLI
jgi:PAS domain S-box-containing protein